MKFSLCMLAAGALLATPLLAQDNPYPNQPYPNQNYPNQNYPNQQYPNQPPPPGNYDNGRASEGYPGNPNSQYPNEVPAGTQLKIRTDRDISVHDQSDGRVYYGTVAENVVGPDGRMLIPRGAVAELVVANVGDRNMRLDLESVTVHNHRYMVDAAAYNRARNEDFGKNRHTGEFVGGGALLGTIVGAIAGGGKGAAIGALAGAGAGAGAQYMTRGNFINVPAESILTFRLEQPMRLGRGRYAEDRGYTRDGVHYHRDYYGQPNSDRPNNNNNYGQNNNNNYGNDNPYRNGDNPPPPPVNNYPNNPQQ